MALIVWLVYLVFGLAIMPLIFRFRFGRWPFAVPLIPRNRYDLAEQIYALVIVASTLTPISQGHLYRQFLPRWWLGLSIMALGVALQIWSVFTLGRWWRIGHEPSEQVEHVRTGPYRLCGHPIYVSLAIIVIGEMFLCRYEQWTLVLMVATVLYSFIQGPLESSYLRRGMTTHDGTR